jgi:Type I restriction enzyme R protein N terminus (HSDR_N)
MTDPTDVAATVGTIPAGGQPSPQQTALPAAPAVPSQTKAVTAVRSGPKWEIEARDRIRSAIKRFSRPLADLVARDANEGDTRLLVTDMLCEALGFDKYEDLTTEYQVKGEFADYGIRIDKQLMAFIEVKRCTTTLSERHLRQVQMYAANEGVEWMLLTNGVVWQAYHLTAGLPLVVDLALEIDLLDDGTKLAEKASTLFYLSRESLKRNQIDELWQARRATAPSTLAAALMSDGMLDELRKEIRRTTGHNPEIDQLAEALRTNVIRAEALNV